MKKSGNTLGVINLLLFIGLALNACTSPSHAPLEITSVSVFPKPIVGRIVTLYIEIASEYDESDVKFTVDTLEYAGNKVHLVGGDVSWQGSLVANQPKRFQVKICVVEEGSWPVEISVGAFQPDNNLWADFEKIQLESSLESGKLIRGFEYTFSQEEHARRPTPRPMTVSLECSGNTK